MLFVSNNRYRLGRVSGSGTRPRLDDGQLRIAAVGAPTRRGWERLLPRRPWREWSARDFEVRSAERVAVGIDGEAAILAAPLRFRTLPSALRVRIARTHPGASPSAAMPDGTWQFFRTLLSMAAGRAVTDP